MKFKGVIESSVGSASQVLVFHILQALQRLDRAIERRHVARNTMAGIVIRLTADTFAFCHRVGVDEGSQTWTHFQVNRLFKEYRIESRRGNKIDLEVPIANLAHVFHSCISSERMTLRLANGQGGRPVLGFEFLLTGNVADHQVEQEVPVRVIPDNEAESIREPSLPEPDYQIELPKSLHRMKNVLDKMKAVGAQVVSIEAAKDASCTGSVQPSGRVWLCLAAEAELVTITSRFPSLPLVMEGKQTPPPEGPLCLNLSLRRFSEVMASFQMLSAEAHIACMIENRALALYALLPNELGTFISYTPVVLI